MAAAVFAVFCFQSQATNSQGQSTLTTPSVVYEAGEQHPTIHRAIRALEAAKADIEAAPHDFCGHRDAILSESNLALNQLGLAIICDKRRDRSDEPPAKKQGTTDMLLSTGLVTEKHPLIHQAISALQSARRDLNSAVHDYCGHRVEALEAVNRALTQLKLALECDND
jgi:hypothetical protein